MAKSKSMIQAPISVDFDKSRQWCFNMAAMSWLAKKYENLGEVYRVLGQPQTGADNITQQTIEVFVDVLYAGFIGYNPDITRDDVINGLGPSNFAYFAMVIGEGMSAQSPDAVPQ